MKLDVIIWYIVNKNKIWIREFKLSKKEVTVEIFQCDVIEADGSQCPIEGERMAIKQCALCSKDLCSRHYYVLNVTKSSSIALTYFFCSDHTDEFINTLKKTFGDTGPIAGAGMAK